MHLEGLLVSAIYTGQTIEAAPGGHLAKSLWFNRGMGKGSYLLCFLHSALVFKARGQCDHHAFPLA